jgi:hypothetical protein
VRSVIGKHGVNGVRHGGDQGAQEVGGDAPGGAFLQFGKRELAGAVNGDEQIELALLGAPSFPDITLLRAIATENVPRPSLRNMACDK